MVRARACEQLSPAGMQHELRSVREQFTFTVCSYQCKYEYQTTNSLTMHNGPARSETNARSDRMNTADGSAVVAVTTLFTCLFSLFDAFVLSHVHCMHMQHVQLGLHRLLRADLFPFSQLGQVRGWW
jgi:hypothetical protein